MIKFRVFQEDNMKLLVDTHTHTVASGHAYSTLRENALFAAKKGLEAFCCTDHGPGTVSYTHLDVYKRQRLS